ncbi:MAG: uroporphyrinogen decarboxylase [Treponema sp.]|jgi:uroporphyrinogen decarboxylase|nr:uroporphyrinogen decarboxylase [Treponema sp.]
MTRREAVIEALEHRDIRPVPWTLSLTGQAADALWEQGKDIGLKDAFGSYITGSYYDGRPVPIPGRPGYFKDDFGVVWNRNGADKDIGVIDGFVMGSPETDDYIFPQIDNGKIRKEIEASVNNRGDRFVFASFGFTMFERAWTLMGMENVLVYMIECPDALEKFFDKLCDFWLGLVDIALEYGIDGVHFGDDWGQQKGLIMGPEYWRRFIKPRMARLYARVKGKGKYVSQHSCGDCREIFPDLIEIGLDCYQTFQPEIYPVAEMKEKYGSKISFWGGVSTQQCLPKSSPAELRREIALLIKTLGNNGGFIIAPTHSVPHDVPVENILAMAEVFQNQEKYV